jgi:hypothetical protein
MRRFDDIDYRQRRLRLSRAQQRRPSLRPGGLVKRLLNHAVGAGLRESEIARAI